MLHRSLAAARPPKWLSFALTFVLGCASPPSPQDAATDVATDPDVAGRDDVSPTDASDGGPLVVPASFEVHAHRGGRALRPENTLAAFEHALDLGADTLELDLHWSADDQLVVWHDPAVSGAQCRLDPAAPAPLPPDPATSAEAMRRVRALSLAQLRGYRCDRNPDATAYPTQVAAAGVVSGDNFGIVTLADVFAMVEAYANDPRKTEAQRSRARRVRYNIESKRSSMAPEYIGDGFDGTTPGPFERAIVELVRARGLIDRVLLQSFDAASLRAARTLEPALTLSYLTLVAEEPDVLAMIGARVSSPSAGFVNRDFVGRAHEAGLRVIPWTVNDPARMRLLIGLGVDGIITDRPDLLLELIARP